MPVENNWIRIINTTTQRYMPGEIVNTLKRYKISAMMMERGRIKMNASGRFLEQEVEYLQADMQGAGDMEVASFGRVNRWKKATLPWRGYMLTDAISDFEIQQNRGVEALVKIAGGMIKRLMKDANQRINLEFFVDGNAAGNEKRWHGINSFMGVSGASASQPIGVSNDTYADLSTALGNYGGNFNGSWPVGNGDTQYDFWTPLIVDYESAVAAPAGWAATTKTWPNTCEEALRYGITHAGRNKSASMDAYLDIVTLQTDMYRQFLEKYSTKERLVVTKGDKKGLYDLGFRDVVHFEGVEITPDNAVPPTEGYGWNFSEVTLECLFGQLFETETDNDITTSSMRYKLKHYGNLMFNPVAFVKWDDVT